MPMRQWPHPIGQPLTQMWMLPQRSLLTAVLRVMRQMMPPKSTFDLDRRILRSE